MHYWRIILVLLYVSAVWGFPHAAEAQSNGHTSAAGNSANAPGWLRHQASAGLPVMNSPAWMSTMGYSTDVMGYPAALTEIMGYPAALTDIMGDSTTVTSLMCYSTAVTGLNINAATAAFCIPQAKFGQELSSGYTGRSLPSCASLTSTLLASSIQSSQTLSIIKQHCQQSNLTPQVLALDSSASNNSSELAIVGDGGLALEGRRVAEKNLASMSARDGSLPVIILQNLDQEDITAGQARFEGVGALTLHIPLLDATSNFASKSENVFVPTQFAEPDRESPERTRTVETNSNACANILTYAYDWFGNGPGDFSELSNGSKITRLPNGTTFIELSSGSQISELPDGSQTKSLAGGVRFTRLSDGTTITELPGQGIIYGGKHCQQQGSLKITRHADSHIVVDLPDGSRLIEAENLLSNKANALNLSVVANRLQFNLPKGDCLLETARDLSVPAAHGTMQISGKSVLFMRKSSSQTFVCNLYDSHAGSVRLNAAGKIVELPPGKALVIFEDRNAGSILPPHDIGIRNWCPLPVHGAPLLYTCEFSIPSALHSVGLLNQLVSSKDSRDRVLLRRLLKMAAALSQTSRESQPYSIQSEQYSTGSRIAL